MRTKPLWPLVAALLAAACSPAEQPTRPPEAEPSVETAGPEGPWRIEASAAAGAALVFGDADGVERLRLICRRGPAQLVVQAPDVKPIGSEERFTLGFGDQLFTLVADVAGAERPFVEAARPLTPDVVAAIRTGEPIAANYGATNLGPHPAPDPPTREAFAKACEGAIG